MASPTIEGGCERLATKADVERLRADVARRLFQLGAAMIGALGLAVAFIKLTG